MSNDNSSRENRQYDFICLNGLNLEVFDTYLIFKLVYFQNDKMYLLLKKNIIDNNYEILKNYENNRELAFKEFENLKKGEIKDDY